MTDGLIGTSIMPVLYLPSPSRQASMGPGLFSPDDCSHSKSFVINEFGTLFREVRFESLSVWVHDVLLFLSTEIS